MEHILQFLTAQNVYQGALKYALIKTHTKNLLAQRSEQPHSSQRKILKVTNPSFDQAHAYLEFIIKTNSMI